MKTKLAIKLLTALGFGAMFSGCEGIIIGADEYGCPSADYEIKGKVTDSDNKPINGIRLSMINYYDSESSEYPDTLAIGYSSADGDYHLSPRRIFPKSEFTLAADDIDGEENGGKFASKSEQVTFTHVDYKGGDRSWYSGTAHRTVDLVLIKDEAYQPTPMYGCPAAAFEDKDKAKH